MYLIRSVLLIFIAQAFTACVNNPTHDQEILYKQKNGKNVDVYNMTQLRFSMEGMSYLKRRDSQYGEFGGQIRLCSDMNYFCMSGGLNVAIPKVLTGQVSWKAANKNCQSDHSISYQKPTIITCTVDDFSTRFVYIPERGIVSYIESSHPKAEFELIGDKGLFATPIDPASGHEVVHNDVDDK